MSDLTLHFEHLTLNGCAAQSLGHTHTESGYNVCLARSVADFSCQATIQ